MSNYKNIFQISDKNTSWSLAYELVKEGSNVLEIGCGNGNFGQAIVKHKNCKVTGIEPDIGDAKEAKKKLNKLIINTIEVSLPQLKSERFDHIIFLDVIEHLYDPVDVLRQSRSLLNDDGTIIFSMPNMGHSSVRTMLLAGNFEYGKTGILDKTHLHFYTNKEIGRVFAEAGFEISELDGVLVKYDENVIKSELKKIGVKPARDLIDALQANDGSIYQFVGLARANSGVDPDKLMNCSPDAESVVNEYYQSEINVYKQELAKIIKEKEFYRQKYSRSLINIAFRVVKKVKHQFINKK